MKFGVSAKSLRTKASREISLKEVAEKRVYSNVSFRAKVINVEDAVKLSGALSKQEVVVADATAAARMTVWEADIKMFESYYFDNKMNGNYFSKPKDDASISRIDDIGDVVEDNLPQRCDGPWCQRHWSVESSVVSWMCFMQKKK